MGLMAVDDIGPAQVGDQVEAQGTAGKSGAAEPIANDADLKFPIAELSGALAEGHETSGSMVAERTGQFEGVAFGAADLPVGSEQGGDDVQESGRAIHFPLPTALALPGAEEGSDSP